jgi:hypothetical protein
MIAGFHFEGKDEAALGLAATPRWAAIPGSILRQYNYFRIDTNEKGMWFTCCQIDAPDTFLVHLEAKRAVSLAPIPYPPLD